MRAPMRPLISAIVVATCFALAGCTGVPGPTSGAPPSRLASGGSGMSLSLDTTAFSPLESSGGAESGGEAVSSRIPVRFAMPGVPGGQNVSIPYSWSEAPPGTRSYALTLVDTAPVAHDWVHWMVVDIAPTARAISEGSSGTSAMPTGSVELRNTFGFEGYGGPQPPPGTGAHPYVATLYALGVQRLDLTAGASLAQFRSAIAGHVLATATCTGTFGR